ncbi:HflK protein [Hahella sp. CCB-MM4]|uniref:FtsH protease activity modulator HflK n=1 Tax=Hahella sp. (strain CCB-MM4) TaxID=1926491 RepID=UPI000B9A990C|nr:FtsH protease activity modulator HflK [Hahella sp. CCB-MM4]OZG71522.1 HflK protein [Hahella sp. CCB-MM4]
MAWNEPGGNKDQDPWGSGRRNNDGPPDLDEVIRKGMEKLNGLFGGKPSRGGSGGRSGGSAGGVIAIIIIVLLGFTVWDSMYRIDEKQRAVVLRFGKYLDTKGPGLQFKIPYIDQIFIEDVTSVRNRPKKGHMLTEDENIVDIDLTVQFVIKDLKDYMLNMRDPITTVDYAIDSALRHEVGSAQMDQVLTEGRAILSINVQNRLQRYLDFYGAGIELRKVNINAAQPPQAVKSSFEEVQRAKEDEQKLVNRAEAYRNQIVPESRGRAQRIIEEANAYKSEVIARAEGETSRFLQVLKIYESAPEVTRERMYIDTMQEVLSNSSKVLVDQDQGNNIMYLPLDRLMNRAPLSDSSSDSSRAGAASQADSSFSRSDDFRTRNEALTRSRR